MIGTSDPDRVRHRVHRLGQADAQGSGRADAGSPRPLAVLVAARCGARRRCLLARSARRRADDHAARARSRSRRASIPAAARVWRSHRCARRDRARRSRRVDRGRCGYSDGLAPLTQLGAACRPRAFVSGGLELVTIVTFRSPASPPRASPAAAWRASALPPFAGRPSRRTTGAPCARVDSVAGAARCAGRVLASDLASSSPPFQGNGPAAAPFLQRGARRRWRRCSTCSRALVRARRGRLGRRAGEWCVRRRPARGPTRSSGRCASPAKPRASRSRTGAARSPCWPALLGRDGASIAASGLAWSEHEPEPGRARGAGVRDRAQKPRMSNTAIPLADARNLRSYARVTAAISRRSRSPPSSTAVAVRCSSRAHPHSQTPWGCRRVPTSWSCSTSRRASPPTVLAHRRHAPGRCRAAASRVGLSSSPARRMKRCRLVRRRRHLAPLVRYFTLPQPARPRFLPTFPANPWTNDVHGRHQHLHRACISRSEIARAQRRRPTVVLVSDLDDDPDDLPALRASSCRPGNGVPVRIVGLNPSSARRRAISDRRSGARRRSSRRRRSNRLPPRARDAVPVGARGPRGGGGGGACAARIAWAPRLAWRAYEPPLGSRGHRAADRRCDRARGDRRRWPRCSPPTPARGDSHSSAATPHTRSRPGTRTLDTFHALGGLAGSLLGVGDDVAAAAGAQVFTARSPPCRSR